MDDWKYTRPVTILLTIIASPLYLYDEIATGSAQRKASAYFKRVISPLRPSLRCALTIPSVLEEESKNSNHRVRSPRKTTSTQAQSGFFKLPWDLREIIYSDALLAIRGVHIRQDVDGRLFAECRQWCGEFPWSVDDQDRGDAYSYRCWHFIQDSAPDRNSNIKTCDTKRYQGVWPYNVLGILCILRQ
ncbi:hypothetical protein BJY04DRAFT_203018, partial [Aspergillus karnatakaensis]|uniref:uncharacterized protein n=1 Tax=Aspergillus karnatakaensis TaxID=1810916 RepID=UPI003CCD7956